MLHGAVEAACGVSADLVLRSAVEWRALVDANPFADADEGFLHLSLLDTPAAGTAAAALADRATAPEAVAVGSREIYWCLPDGVTAARSLWAASNGSSAGPPCGTGGRSDGSAPSSSAPKRSSPLPGPQASGGGRSS